MKKLRFTVLILSFLFIFIACKKSNDSIKISAQDSLQAVNDTTIKEIDSIWNNSEKEFDRRAQTEKSKYLTDSRNSSAKEKREKIAARLNSSSIDDIELLSAALGDGSDRIVSVKACSRSTASSRSNVANLSAMDGVIAKNIKKMDLGGSSSNERLGFSVGGAKDIGNFRENIKNNYMPDEEDITYEGIFYDYFFDNNITKEATHLFEPAYTAYKNINPITKEEELYLSVGLNSNLTEASFKRKKLNLTIVLDISGSMKYSFNRDYTSQNEGRPSNWDSRSKIEIAKECIIDLTKHLNEDDRLAVVLFNAQSHLAKPFKLLNKTNMTAIRAHINDIKADGATNMYAGFSTASELYENLPQTNPEEYDNRIIFLTDAKPNTDITDKNSLWGLMKANAEKNIYSSFIGIGLDFNSELINYITKTPGANYYSVHNADEFKKKMDTQFDFMVTPLVFDLSLRLQSKKYDIEAIYGAPEAKQATGEIMKINTLFPSESTDGKTRGGIVLIKLKQTGNGSDDIKLTCSYKDRDGVPDLITEDIKFTKNLRGTDNGIRKAVLLTRYVNLMHDWINNKTIKIADSDEDDWLYGKESEPRSPGSSRRSYSSQLVVNTYYQAIFAKFKDHFAQEASDIKDKDLQQELDILDFLINYDNSSSPINNRRQSYQNKEEAVREWFDATILPRINHELDRYKLRKVVRGELTFKLIFKNDKVVKCLIREKGSINDKEFIKNLEDIIEKKIVIGIGDYRINIKQNFD